MGVAVDWLAGLSPWPADGFGLDRMQELLSSLGDPQRAFEAVHVVGTNGKSTATRMIEALLLADGWSVGANVSPHVRSWAERIRVDGEEADIEVAVGRVREPAERVDATQFETITAAAFAAFAAAGVDVAVVEAGLGGRLDATNVLAARVVLLTNVGLDHTDVLGDSREEIAREKLAVASPESVVVLPDHEFAHLVPGRAVLIGGARAAAEAFAGHRVPLEPDVSLPGRFEIRATRPLEIYDGAHNPDGVAWLAKRLEQVLGAGARAVLVTSILGDKDARAMLERLRPWVERVVATCSSSARARSAENVAAVARGVVADGGFAVVEAIDDPVAALARARALAGPDGIVLVAGSLYLLADLASCEEPAHRWRS